MSFRSHAKLNEVILPTFYQRPDHYAQVMRSAIALNGAFFHAQRMILQYMGNAYFLPEHPAPAAPEAPRPIISIKKRANKSGTSLDTLAAAGG